MTSVFFSQFKTYCREIEETSIKLRNQSNKNTNSTQEEIIFDCSFIENLQHRLTDATTTLNQCERNFNGLNSLNEVCNSFNDLFNFLSNSLKKNS